MIIGIDGSRAFIKNKTGTESYSYCLLKALAKIDKINTYYIYLYGNITINHAEWPENFIFKPINIKKFWTQAGLSLQTFKDKDLDVLFIPSHTLPLFRRSNLKTVMTVHDLGAEFLPKTHQIKQRLYLKVITDYQLKTADRLIAVSQATKQDIIKTVGISENKISVIYEGFDQDTFKVLSKSKVVQTLKKYNLEYQSYFIFVGTIQPRKNLERLIRAYNKFKRSIEHSNSQQSFISPKSQNTHPIPPLILAGNKGWLSENIYNLPNQFGIENFINFLGFVPNQDLVSLYNGSLGLLFPSLFEGFGIPILEAFASDCPVLTSKVSSMPEVAGEASLLVDPYSEDEISQGIINLYQNPKLRDQLIRKGQAQVKKFSWVKTAQETLAVLEKLVKS